MNNLFISGRLGADAEVRYTQDQKAICNFSVAVDDGYGDDKKTTWFRCALFGKRAEGKLPEYLTKGQQVNVLGSVKLNEFDGEKGKMCSLEVFVREVELTGGKSDSAPQAKPAAQKADDFGDDIPFNVVGA